MRTKIIFLIVLGMLAFSCEDESAYLGVSGNEINLDAAGTAQTIEVNTGEDVWQISGNISWLTIGRDSCYVTFSAPSNPKRAERSGSVVIVAGDRFERVQITQAGSAREVGEPYPDAVNPIGIIYKTTDGGNHGKVISFDQFEATWGPTTEVNNPAARSYDNGKSNTRNLIQAHRERADFALEYPAFDWVYNEKNQGNLEGGWYIPAYYELMELFYILAGSSYTIPSSIPSALGSVPARNIAVWDGYNNTIASHGGTPMSFSSTNTVTVNYWSSSENDITRAYSVRFGTSGTTSYATKSSSFLVRAIYEF